MRFAPGDRVELVSSLLDQNLIGVTGTVVFDRGTHVRVTMDAWVFGKNPHSDRNYWSFYRSGYTLGLIDQGPDKIEEMFA